MKPGVEYNVNQLNRFVFEQAGRACAAAFELYGVPFTVGKIQEQRAKMLETPKYKRLVNERDKAKSEMRPAVGPGDEVHRELPGRQFLGEARSPEKAPEVDRRLEPLAESLLDLLKHP